MAKSIDELHGALLESNRLDVRRERAMNDTLERLQVLHDGDSALLTGIAQERYDVLQALGEYGDLVRGLNGHITGADSGDSSILSRATSSVLAIGSCGFRPTLLPMT